MQRPPRPRPTLGTIAAATALATCLQAAPAPAATALPVRRWAARQVQPGSQLGCTVSQAAPKFDMRAEWIASVVNIDWPSRPGLTASQQKAELTTLLDRARARGMNAVILQVRPTADTFWPSSLEPWSQWLSGRQGVNPGWDPLAVAVAQAHARGMELHAWVNPYRVAMDSAGKDLVATHPARVHPNWVVPYGGKLYYNPGLPEVRKHVVDTIVEMVRTHAVDAVHFDDYFYPYPVSGAVFNDAAAFKAYGAGRTLAQWRRSNIDALINDVRTRVRATRPGTQFGVSPFGVWRNQASDATGSATSAGVQTYDDLAADTRTWMRQGMVDYMIPQIYWSKTLSVANYTTLATWWAGEAARSPRANLYLGEATYKVAANSDTAWNQPGELASHLAVSAQVNGSTALPLIKGHAYFSATDVNANRLDAMGIVQRTWYRHPALTPATPWLDQTPPAAPKAGRAGTTLTIQWPAGATRAVVYRVAKRSSQVTPCDLADATHIAAILPAGTTSWTLPADAVSSGDTWLVSAVDKASNESKAAVAW